MTEMPVHFGETPRCCQCSKLNFEEDETGYFHEGGELKWICGWCWAEYAFGSKELVNR